MQSLGDFSWPDCFLLELVCLDVVAVQYKCLDVVCGYAWCSRLFSQLFACRRSSYSVFLLTITSGHRTVAEHVGRAHHCIPQPSRLISPCVVACLKSDVPLWHALLLWKEESIGPFCVHWDFNDHRFACTGESNYRHGLQENCKFLSLNFAFLAYLVTSNCKEDHLEAKYYRCSWKLGTCM